MAILIKPSNIPQHLIRRNIIRCLNFNRYKRSETTSRPTRGVDQIRN